MVRSAPHTRYLTFTAAKAFFDIPAQMHCDEIGDISDASACVHTCYHRGELYPVETDLRLCDILKTGSEVTVDMEANVLTDHSTGKTYDLKAIGDVSGDVRLAECLWLWRQMC
eukprot:1161240-Pelagomonas_calceolata.AAC.10